ncbi:single-stranded-DNA-specific exonuclease RecJ [Candidatus Bipolaricaulota bacterium]|nr:single-stranded-DNA-specific exonuclease RecJ [Candidatus Bipolaricaulota bacterium]
MRSLIRGERRWEISPLPEENLVNQIITSLSCVRPFAVLLAQRGAEQWRRLIDPDVDLLHSPFLLSGMNEAVARVIAAKDKKEKIYIHGDFDADGLTGSAVLYLGLLPLFPTGTIKVDVGDRGHGHGLSRRFVQHAIGEGFSLVITVDCGISDVEAVATLKDSGIDTIITDHHLPADEIPPALAVIDAHQEGDPYPNRHLAGVGVAFKLISALYERLNRPAPYELLDLVALGTIADLVPLAEGSEIENRALVRKGFSLITRAEGSSLGLQVLAKRLSINVKRISARDIGYFIAPKLNAANRAGDPKVAFLLLTTKDRNRAEYLTEILLDYNRDREIAQRDLIAQAEEQLATNGAHPRDDGIVVLSGKHWNEGILGLAASSLADRYHVPAIVISQGSRVSRASCRSVEGFDMAECLNAHSDLLIRYGGHKMAAGFSLENDRLDELRERLLQYMAQQPIRTGSGIETIDAEVAAREIDIRFYTNLRSLSPYGPGNPSPLLLLRDCLFEEMTFVGAGRQHLKGRLVQNGVSLPFIAFRMANHIDLFEDGPMCVVFRAGFDDWRGSVQVDVVDLVACE